MRLHVGIFHKKEIYITGVILIIVVAVVAGLPLMMQGQTVTVGEKPDIVTSDTMTCKAVAAVYPYLDGLEGEKSYDITVKMIYAGDALRNVGLYYDTNYDSASYATRAADMIRATMNMTFVKAGYGANAPEVRVSLNGNSVQMSMYADADGLKDERILPFLMMENADYKKAAMKVAFEERGFTCE